jgi:hypothetical protein
MCTHKKIDNFHLSLGKFMQFVELEVVYNTYKFNLPSMISILIACWSINPTLFKFHQTYTILWMLNIISILIFSTFSFSHHKWTLNNNAFISGKPLEDFFIDGFYLHHISHFYDVFFLQYVTMLIN